MPGIFQNAVIQGIHGGPITLQLLQEDSIRQTKSTGDPGGLVVSGGTLEDNSHIVTSELNQSLHKEYTDRLEGITIRSLVLTNRKHTVARIQQRVG